jgi:hypothetical protein
MDRAPRPLTALMLGRPVCHAPQSTIGLLDRANKEADKE